MTVALGFIGTGWIGRNRLAVMLEKGEARAVAICDPDPNAATQALELAPDAMLVASLDELLALRPDGVVIATPSAIHAEQCLRAFDSGAAVFCQKPLGRHGPEVSAVLDGAKRANRLLGVDLSYRHAEAISAIRELIRAGELGNVFAADLTFHNAYGPQSGWFWDSRLSGGGCLIDLGVHLVDLALWMFDFPEVVETSAALLHNGREVADGEVEDYATGDLLLANGVRVRISCSWNLCAGCDAVIGASFYGTKGGAQMRNESGSFYDFSADLLKDRTSQRIASPPDAWSGRAATDWLQKLAAGERFSASTTGLLDTAQTIDALYASASAPLLGNRAVSSGGRSRPELGMSRTFLETFVQRPMNKGHKQTDRKAPHKE